MVDKKLFYSRAILIKQKAGLFLRAIVRYRVRLSHNDGVKLYHSLVSLHTK